MYEEGKKVLTDNEVSNNVKILILNSHNQTYRIKTDTEPFQLSVPRLLNAQDFREGYIWYHKQLDITLQLFKQRGRTLISFVEVRKAFSSYGKELSLERFR